MENDRKRAAILLIIIGIVIIAVIAFLILGGNDSESTNNNSDENVIVEEDQDPIGNEDLENEVVEGVKLEKSSLKYAGNETILETTVTNDNTAKTNFRFYITFMDGNGNSMTDEPLLAYVGPLEPNESRIITSSVTENLGNYADIIYEIAE